MNMYRQGDVFILAYEGEVPSAATVVDRDQNRIVLAYGEVTGHAHAIHDAGAELLSVPDLDDRFLRIMSGVELRHEEHDTITLPAGTYIVRQQREYSPQEIVRVAD